MIDYFEAVEKTPIPYQDTDLIEYTRFYILQNNFLFINCVLA